MLELYVRMVTFMAGRKATISENPDRGATAVEYGLLVALIAAVIVGTVATLGGQINTAFNAIVTELTP